MGFLILYLVTALLVFVVVGRSALPTYKGVETTKEKVLLIIGTLLISVGWIVALAILAAGAIFGKDSKEPDPEDIKDEIKKQLSEAFNNSKTLEN